MIPYVLLLLFVIIAFFYEQILCSKTLAKKKDIYLIYLLVVLFATFMTGFRDMIGGYDIYIYASFFERVPTVSDFFSLKTLDRTLYLYFEPGYLFLNTLVKTISDDKYIFFLIAAIVSYSFISKAIYRYPLATFALFIFISKFFIVGFVYTRQFIAMGIIWWAIQFLEQNNRIKFILASIVAVSIHVSSLILFPIIFIYKCKFSKKALTFFFVVSLILGITPFIKLAMDFANQYLMISKIDNYAEAEQTAFHIPYFIETSLFAIGLHRYRDKLYADSRYSVLMNLGVLYVVFSFLTLRDAGVVRLIWYYVISYLVLVPYMLNNFKKAKILVLGFVISYFSLVYLRNVIVRDGGNFIPYKATFMDTKRVDKFE